MLVSMTEHELGRTILENYDAGYSQGAKDATVRAHRWAEQQTHEMRVLIAHLREQLHTALNFIAPPIYLVPPVADQTLAACVAKLEGRVDGVKNDLDVVERHGDKQRDVLIAGMELTSKRVSNIADRVTEVERLKNTKADAVTVARLEARLNDHITNLVLHW